MIRLIPGPLNPGQGVSGPVFTPGRILSLRVIGAGKTGWKVLIEGKSFSVSSNIPLRKGDVFSVKVVPGAKGVELKLINPGGSYAGGTSGLEELLRSDPEIVRAMIRAGIPLKEEDLDRFRRLLQGKPDKEQDARFLTILKEKDLLALGEHGYPVLYEKNDPDGQKGDNKRDEDTTWPEVPFDTRGARKIFNRKTARVSNITVFNHKRSDPHYHKMIIPFRVSCKGDIYNGELRLNIHIAEHRLVEGVLVMSGETDKEQEWIFGFSDSPEKKFVPIRIPHAHRKKLSGLIEKVRKLGLPIVDTVSKGSFDGYSLDAMAINRGIDAKA